MTGVMSDYKQGYHIGYNETKYGSYQYVIELESKAYNQGYEDGCKLALKEAEQEIKENEEKSKTEQSKTKKSS